MVSQHMKPVPVAVREALHRAAGGAVEPVDPSPDWCDDEPVPRVVGVATAPPAGTAGAPDVSPKHARPGAGRLPWPALFFFAILVAGYAAGFGIGTFAPR